MGFESRWLTGEPVLTTVLAWTFQTLVTVATSGDKTRVKNLFVKGIYWVDQTTEVNTQYGTLGLGLIRAPDTQSTPDPDWTTNLGGIDKQILKPTVVMSAGVNNPVLFTFSYRAINVSPGQKLIWALHPLEESGASINHRVVYAVQFWESDD